MIVRESKVEILIQSIIYFKNSLVVSNYFKLNIVPTSEICINDFVLSTTTSMIKLNVGGGSSANTTNSVILGMESREKLLDEMNDLLKFINSKLRLKLRFVFLYRYIYGLPHNEVIDWYNVFDKDSGIDKRQYFRWLKIIEKTLAEY